MTVTATSKLPTLPPLPEPFSDLRAKVEKMKVCNDCAAIRRGERLKSLLRTIDTQNEQIQRLRAKASLGKPPVPFYDWSPKLSIEQWKKKCEGIPESEIVNRVKGKVTWEKLIAEEVDNLDKIEWFARMELNKIVAHCFKSVKPLPKLPAPTVAVPSIPLLPNPHELRLD